jgi:peptide/nickel transport system permease protein
MLTFVARRVAYSVPVVLLASVLVFVFVRTTTDPLARLRASRDPTVIAREEHRLGLDRPLPAQYVRWLGDFTRGRWGESYVSRRSVGREVREKLWNTVQLIVWGILVSALIAIGIGVYSAIRQYSPLDYAFTGASFIGLSMPPFWFGLMAIQFFAFMPRQWFHLEQPILFSVGKHSAVDTGVIDYLRHLALPVMTLSVQLVAGWSRYQRSSMLDVLGADYMRTARAKGLRELNVIMRHGVRNSLIPLTTVMAVDVGSLFGGLIITETIFSWPGMGKLFYDSLLNGDIPVLLPWLVVTALFIVGFNLLADVMYAVLDPRIRY